MEPVGLVINRDTLFHNWFDLRLEELISLIVVRSGYFLGDILAFAGHFHLGCQHCATLAKLIGLRRILLAFL